VGAAMAVVDDNKDLDFLTTDQLAQLMTVFKEAEFEEYKYRLSAFSDESERIEAKHMEAFFRAWKKLPEDLKEWVRYDLQSIAAQHGANSEHMQKNPMSFDLCNVENRDIKRIPRRIGSPPKYIGHKEVVSLLVDFWIAAGRDTGNGLIGRPEADTKNRNNYNPSPLISYVARYLMKIDPKFLPETHSNKTKRDHHARQIAYEIRAYSALDDQRASIQARRVKKA
jgi:hypothetical protein